MRLFEEDEGLPNADSRPPRPLADRMRPKSLDQFVGQTDVLGPDKPLPKLIERGKIPSLIIWGPPGSGKTTLGRILASRGDYLFIEVSAVESGVKDLRAALGRADDEWRRHKRRTVLFIDEVHRFSKVQQDAILPSVESGRIVIVGSTTENPAFEVIPALRSRCRIFRMAGLGCDEVITILDRALCDSEQGLVADIDDAVINRIATRSGGDARVALNLLEAAVHSVGDAAVTAELIDELARESSILYDKQGQEHFDHASAFQKSMRGSDPDAAIYWLARMIDGGEDPRFIARRLMVTASEDVGLADPGALLIAVAAADTVERIGMPECRIALAHATIHIATAPKSNSACKAIDGALRDIRQGDANNHTTPDHLKDTHYKAAKDFGFGEGYKYPHSFPDHWVAQKYLPEAMQGSVYYEPGELGREKAWGETAKKRSRRLRK